jgi:hypothetical protein
MRATVSRDRRARKWRAAEIGRDICHVLLCESVSGVKPAISARRAGRR